MYSFEQTSLFTEFARKRNLPPNLSFPLNGNAWKLCKTHEPLDFIRANKICLLIHNPTVPNSAGNIKYNLPLGS